VPWLRQCILDLPYQKPARVVRWDLKLQDFLVQQGRGIIQESQSYIFSVRYSANLSNCGIVAFESD